jgi:hypothetical protein
MEYNTNNYYNINNIYDENNIDKNNKSDILVDNLILKKKKLIDISKNLSKIEYFEIFNIIKQDNCQYTENKNGVFINLLNVSEKTIDKIFNFINFIKHKKEDLFKHEEIITYTKNIIDINVNKNVEKYTEYNDTNEKKNEILNSDSDNDNEYDEKTLKSSNYLVFSSDEDEDLENKLSLKKKKIKYTGKKAKMIKSIKDSNDVNKNKNKNKKNND